VQKLLLCDPQTSGGLLIAVEPAEEAAFLAMAVELGLNLSPIGELVERQRLAVEVF
jgi:selenide,water dikinase